MNGNTDIPVAPERERLERWQRWTLFGIILAGVFLRTYHFQSLLIFASDQSRDFNIVRNVVEHYAAWPLLGPDMTGGHGFRLGAIYYSFQILSAKLFGVSPMTQAYPDLVFSVLSIPLLFYFVRRAFRPNVALLSVAMYSISFFVIEYSRFAWNVNLIPFFSVLFLLAFWQLLCDGAATEWLWVMLAGFALGVGVQLHAIMLLLFPAMAVPIMTFLLWKDRRAWRKLLVVILVALALNTGQLVSEQRTGFANTQRFLGAFVFKSQRTDSTLAKGLVLDVACNVQADMHILTSLGNRNICDFLYDGQEISTTYRTAMHLDRDPWSIAGKAVSLLFVAIAVGLLMRTFLRERDRRRKYLLGLILVYGLLYFLIMIPIAPGSRMRYYLPIAFLPFVFLSTIADTLTGMFPRRYVWILSGIAFFLVVANVSSIRYRLENSGCDKATRTNFGCNLPMGADITK